MQAFAVASACFARCHMRKLTHGILTRRMPARCAFDVFIDFPLRKAGGFEPADKRCGSTVGIAAIFAFKNRLL
jgi:hypothetical protein